MKLHVLILSLIVATVTFAETDKTTNGEVYHRAIGVPFLGMMPVADPVKKAEAKPAEPAREVAALSVEPVYFELDKALIDADGRAKVATIAGWLKANPDSKVKVEAYTDPSGTVEHNKTLGAKRAVAMQAALAKEGIAPNRVITVNHGGKPVERKAVITEYTVLAD